MRKTIKIAFLSCLFLYTLSISAQTTAEEYFEAEHSRIQIAQSVDHEIDNFISANIAGYNLSSEDRNRLRRNLSEEGITVPNEIQKALNKLKEIQLRKLYFEKHPGAANYFNAGEIPPEIQQDCINGGFENASTAGYNFFSDTSPAFSACGTPAATNIAPAPALNNFNARISRMSSVNANYQQFDPNLQAQGVYVATILTGNGSIRLNNMVSDNITDETTMTRIFPSINEAFLDFNFSLILQNPGHAPIDQPFFRARVLDANGNVVDNICIVSDPANCLFTQAPGTGQLLYTGWICARLNVQSILGQQGTLEITVADCGLTGHQGMVYIDNVCGATCPNPAFGSIDLDPLQINCPSEPIQICGNYQAPTNATLGTLSLDILQGNTVVNTLYTTSQLTSNSFCFTIDPDYFGLNPSGTFTFQVNVAYNVNCPAGIFQYNASDMNGVVSFKDCCLATLPSNLIITGSLFEQRSDWITSTDFIDNPAPSDQVVYHAGNYIELLPGFESVFTSHFAAYIEECSNNFLYRNSQILHKPGNRIVKDYNGKDQAGSDKIRIFPNPSNRSINITYDGGDLKRIKITSIDGKVMLDQDGVSEPNEIDVSRYSNGIYLITVETPDGKTLQSKFIKD